MRKFIAQKATGIASLAVPHQAFRHLSGDLRGALPVRRIPSKKWRDLITEVWENGHAPLRLDFPPKSTILTSWSLLLQTPFFEHHSVIFYFDGKSNPEATYNFDDKPLVIGPHERSLDCKNSIGQSDSTTAIFFPLENGYLLEARFELGAIGVPDQIEGGNYDAENAVIGFDLVNCDLDVLGKP